jgi:hypothetical protein
MGSRDTEGRRHRGGMVGGSIKAPGRLPDAKYERAALRWHARFAYETKNVDIRESVAVLALLTAIPANRLAAAALAELFSRRRSLERCAEALVHWARTV